MITINNESVKNLSCIDKLNKQANEYFKNLDRHALTTYPVLTLEEGSDGVTIIESGEHAFALTPPARVQNTFQGERNPNGCLVRMILGYANASSAVESPEQMNHYFSVMVNLMLVAARKKLGSFWGHQEITFKQPNGNYFTEVEAQAGYELRLYFSPFPSE